MNEASCWFPFLYPAFFVIEADPFTVQAFKVDKVYFKGGWQLGSCDFRIEVKDMISWFPIPCEETYTGFISITKTGFSGFCYPDRLADFMKKGSLMTCMSYVRMSLKEFLDYAKSARLIVEQVKSVKLI